MSQQIKMTFLTVSEFKIAVDADTIAIVKSPKTGKLFAAANKVNYKVQGTIDLSKDIRFMYETDGDFAEGCFVNVPDNENLVGTL